MDQFQQLGARFRAVRIRRGWRQTDLAGRVGLSASVISRIERGHVERIQLGSILAVARALDIQVSLATRSRGADLDRLMSGRHSAFHESVARWFAAELPDWTLDPEVSFSIYGERGIIDILAWHPGHRALVIIELKTDIVDVNELIGQMDRRRRLAREIVEERGWDPLTVSTWVIVANGRTNRARLAAHRVLLRNAFPVDGRSIRSWLARPDRPIAALSLWDRVEGGTVAGGYAARHRVRARGASAGRRRRADQIAADQNTADQIAADQNTADQNTADQEELSSGARNGRPASVIGARNRVRPT